MVENTSVVGTRNRPIRFRWATARASWTAHPTFDRCSSVWEPVEIVVAVTGLPPGECLPTGLPGRSCRTSLAAAAALGRLGAGVGLGVLGFVPGELEEDVVE